jgi:hypothetical protein
VQTASQLTPKVALHFLLRIAATTALQISPTVAFRITMQMMVQIAERTELEIPRRIATQTPLRVPPGTTSRTVPGTVPTVIPRMVTWATSPASNAVSFSYLGQRKLAQPCQFPFQACHAVFRAQKGTVLCVRDRRPNSFVLGLLAAAASG